MSSLLDDSKSKLDWADKRFADLQREIENFRQLNPYEEIIQPDPNEPSHKVRKVRLTKLSHPILPTSLGRL